MVGDKCLFVKPLQPVRNNKTHDPVRVALVGFCFMYLLAFLWGIIMLTVAFFTHRDFDLSHPYIAFGELSTGFGLFMLSGAGSLLMKKSTEPNADGSMPEQTAGSTVIGIGNTVGPVEKKTVEDPPHDPN